MSEQIATRNPLTGQTVTTYEPFDDVIVEDAVSAARAAQVRWAGLSVDERAVVLRRAGSLLRERRDELARLMATEMGKPVVQGRAEVEKCATLCDHYVAEATTLLAPRQVTAEGRVELRPIGTVLGIMPWNFPFWQALRFAVPNLLLGNACLLKHAPNVPGCALAIQSLFADAGVPAGVFTSLLIIVEQTERLIGHDGVDGVTLTGSDTAGRRVAQLAGAALKKSVLELGGSDPFVVLEDADLLAAVNAAVASRTMNAGQSCIAAKRFIVHAGIAEDFLDRFAAAMADVTVGDPLEDETGMGPLARPDLLATIDRQVQESVALGAAVRCGGTAIGTGSAYAPTILTEVDGRMPVWTEETFGPVAAVRIAGDDAEALALANDTSFGLGAAVWSSAPDRVATFVEGLRAGMVFVNDMVRSDVRLPFGGVGRSGYGRELADQGVREFANEQTVWVAPT